MSKIRSESYLILPMPVISLDTHASFPSDTKGSITTHSNTMAHRSLPNRLISFLFSSIQAHFVSSNNVQFSSEEAAQFSPIEAAQFSEEEAQ